MELAIPETILGDDVPRAVYFSIAILDHPFGFAAIFAALLASITLTAIWEEWVIWRLSSRPAGAGFFAAVLRANLYVLLLIMIVPAVLILPKRLRSPEFTAHRHNARVTQASNSAH